MAKSLRIGKNRYLEAELEMVFWLVLVAFSSDGMNPQMLHVGNFASAESCQRAADEAKYFGNTLNRVFVCVRANDDKTKPPAGL